MATPATKSARPQKESKPPLWTPAEKEDDVLKAIAKYGPIAKEVINEISLAITRDKFAEVALQGVLAKEENLEDVNNDEWIAQRAYEIADAMMKARRAVARG